MDVVDAMLFVLLAAGDLALIVFLRKRHNRRQRLERMARCLAEAVRRELRIPARRPNGNPQIAENKGFVPALQNQPTALPS